MDEIKFATKPVGEIVGPAMLAAFYGIESGHGCIVKRDSIDLSGPLDAVVALTDLRELTVDQIDRLRTMLTTSESYWTGHPIYKRFPPRPEFLFRLQSKAERIDLAVDLQNPGWRIDCAGQSYWAFTFAGASLRANAKELFPEYASGSKMATWKKGSLPDKNR